LPSPGELGLSGILSTVPCAPFAPEENCRHDLFFYGLDSVPVRDVNQFIFRLSNFFIVLVFVFQKSIIITEIALGDNDQFARRYA